MIRIGMSQSLMLFLCVVAPGLANQAHAQTPRGNLGTLTCTLAEDGEKQKMPPSEERAMRCMFKPTESGVELTYSGTIRKVGAGQELTGKLVMIWVVQGPQGCQARAKALGPDLRGGGDTSASKGAVANSLIGESNKDITLQAETTQGEPKQRNPIMTMELKVQSVPV